MKIVYCILNTWYAGGLTRVLTNKANYLAEHGFDVTIVTTDQLGHGHFYPMSDKITFVDLNIPYVGYDAASFSQKLKHVPIVMYKHRKALAKLLKDIKPNIVISLFGKELFFLPLIKDGSKKILEAHSSRFTWLDSREGRGISGRIQKWTDLFFVKKFDKLIVLTKEDMPDWIGVKKIEVIPNANTFEPSTSSLLNNKIVLASGRYGYQKNFEDLVRVWSIVHKKHTDWILNIRGQGLDLLAPFVKDMGLQDAISMQHSNNMQEECLNASIFALTSRYEGLPMVMLEAQACGIPLVSYACKCGPRDIISEGENGFLVNVGDIEGLAEKISLLIEDEELRKRMGRSAKAKSNDFSEEKIMKKWISLFSKLREK